MNRPDISEYNDFFRNYIDLVPEGDFLTMLNKNTVSTIEFFNKIPKELENYSYEKNKWTIKELLAHLIDSDRVFSYRILVCLRMDNNIIIPEMDENSYAKNRNIDQITMTELIEEFTTIRKGIVQLYKYTKEKEQTFKAITTSGNITARALGYIIIGHAIHHKNVITNRYF